ncbi:hypothetical protein [Sinorhizobium americanum]|uniref:Uncharacterized protein n=1 Tax=Sinorhizobium americanum TaxID=194963 RepID=A0A1L3LKY4_9HYPH|nr:hypothetical protein [Sinorhizobium americanum]APG84210.1 hypothetical protein SAMCCGM7_Ch1446 [Sinorhizobium americanum CCGM7]APG90758.1 hypothetical protein SAMCFNEI73_Ch1452 [Sinorhizobium americanum]OAP48400.1 hypothetical protein ATC00_19175 [Sinorhizobium americanum]TCN28185.1 hypothetical protein EV184_11410 [Sinorhizobium americanum]
MHKPLLIALCLLLPAGALRAQEGGILPSNITFVTSTGYWEDGAGAMPSGDPEGGTKRAAQRGYYKLIAVRQTDGTARIHLQQIASTPAGPDVVSSAELEEFTAMRPFVTDIRPETSTGITRQPGMFATVYLKTDPSATEPESWTVLIDEVGDIKIERATN